LSGDGLTIAELSAIESYSVGMTSHPSASRTTDDNTNSVVTNRQFMVSDERSGSRADEASGSRVSMSRRKAQSSGSSKFSDRHVRRHVEPERPRSPSSRAKKNTNNGTRYDNPTDNGGEYSAPEYTDRGTDDYTRTDNSSTYHHGYAIDDHESRDERVDNDYHKEVRREPSGRNDYLNKHSSDHHHQEPHRHNKGHNDHYETQPTKRVEQKIKTRRVSTMTLESKDEDPYISSKDEDPYMAGQDVATVEDIPPAETDMAFAGSDEEMEEEHNTATPSFQYGNKEQQPDDDDQEASTKGASTASSVLNSLARLEQQRKIVQEELHGGGTTTLQSDSFSTLTKTVATLRETDPALFRKEMANLQNSHKKLLQQYGVPEGIFPELGDMNPAQQKLEELLKQQQIQEEKLQKQLEQLRVQKERLQQLQNEKKQVTETKHSRESIASKSEEEEEKEQGKKVDKKRQTRNHKAPHEPEEGRSRHSSDDKSRKSRHEPEEGKSRHSLDDKSRTSRHEPEEGKSRHTSDDKSRKSRHSPDDNKSKSSSHMSSWRQSLSQGSSQRSGSHRSGKDKASICPEEEKEKQEMIRRLDSARQKVMPPRSSKGSSDASTKSVEDAKKKVEEEVTGSKNGTVGDFPSVEDKYTNDDQSSNSTGTITGEIPGYNPPEFDDVPSQCGVNHDEQGPFQENDMTTLSASLSEIPQDGSTVSSLKDDPLQQVLSSMDEEIDLDFVAKYDRAFNAFLDAYPALFEKDSELIQNLKVAKLQKILEVSYQTECDLEAQLENTDDVKSELETEFRNKLKEASREKAERSIQLQTNLSHVKKQSKILEGKLTWEMLQSAIKRANRLKKIRSELKRKNLSTRKDLIAALPATEVDVKCAIFAQPRESYGDGQKRELQQYQVDNAFLSSEVRILQQKVASVREEAKKQLWVDAVLVHLDSKKQDKLKIRYQKKLGVSI